MKTKITAWLDRDRMVPVFGVKVLVGDVWANVAVDGKPLLFDTEFEAKSASAEYANKPRPPRASARNA